MLTILVSLRHVHGSQSYSYCQWNEIRTDMGRSGGSLISAVMQWGGQDEIISDISGKFQVMSGNDGVVALL